MDGWMEGWLEGWRGRGVDGEGGVSIVHASGTAQCDDY